MHLIYTIDGKQVSPHDLLTLNRLTHDWEGYQTVKELQPGQETAFAGKTVRCDFDMSKMERRVVYTTAPECYDYSFAFIKTVETFDCVSLGGSSPKTWRKLEVVGEPGHIDYQFRRYASGLHAVWDEDPREEVRRFNEKMAADKREEEQQAAQRETALVWLRSCSDDEIQAALRSDDGPPKGLTYEDLREERAARAGRAAKAELDARYEEAVKRIPDALVWVDKKSGSRTAHLNVKIEKTWNGEVVVSSDLRVFSSPEDVYFWMDEGVLLPAPEDLPPKAVLDRFGRDRLGSIHTFNINGQNIYVGRKAYEFEILILNEKGHKVRKKDVARLAERLFHEKVYGQ